MSNGRVILHIDLDCFYAQVEQKRLGIARDVPVAVQQWEGLIAVNYAARASGITRHMRVAEAVTKCPDLVLVHVETIGSGGAGNEDASAAGVVTFAPTEEDEHGTKGEESIQAPGSSIPTSALASNIPITTAPSPVATTSAATCTAAPVTNNNNNTATGAVNNTATVQQSHRHLRLTEKACLERYRRANADIMQLLHRLVPTSVIEKASIDEVYIDVTSLVDKELEGQRHDDNNYSNSSVGQLDGLHHLEEFGEQEQEREHQGGGCGQGPSIKKTINNINTSSIPHSTITAYKNTADAFAWGSVVEGNAPLDPDSEFDKRLACGAGIACRLRGAILRDLGFTSSAGIAGNKLLAKIGSAMHKPNQQTLIPPRGVESVMKNMPLGKIKNFGGKLGTALGTLGCTTAGEVAALPPGILEREFGRERAAWISGTVRGQSSEPVEEKEKPKSMLAAKSFTATSDTAALQRWIRVLATELAPRMAADEGAFKRKPKTLVVHFRGGRQGSGGGGGRGGGGGTGGNFNSGDRSRQCAMPRFPGRVPCAETIATAAWEVFTTRCAAEALPCSRLAISAGDFQDLPASNASAITRFLVPKSVAGGISVGKDGGVGKEEGGGGKNGDRGGGLDNATAAAAAQKASLQSGTIKKRGIEAVDPTAEKQKEGVIAGGKRMSLKRQAIGIENGDAAEASLDAELLSGVDIAQQRRLLKEAEMLNALGRRSDKKNNNNTIGGSSGGGAGANSAAGPVSRPAAGAKQAGIARFFQKK